MRAKFILAAAAALSTTANAQSIVNGSFENGTDPGAFTTVNAGETAITGWTVTNGSVDYIGSYWPAQDGSRSVDLSGNGPGTIAQDLTGLVAGRSYQVNFFYGGNFDGPPPAKTFDVSVGATTASYTYPGTVGTGFSGWTPGSFRFVAGSGSNTLSFASTTVGSPFGAALDNVSISAVPEPATWALMIMGFGAAGGAMRRRRVPVSAIA